MTDNPKTILTSGIVSVVCSVISGLLYNSLPLLGLISSALAIYFGATGKSSAKNYVNLYGKTTGQVKAGSILSNIGFIVGIVNIVIFAVTLLLALLTRFSSSYY